MGLRVLKGVLSAQKALSRVEGLLICPLPSKQTMFLVMITFLPSVDDKNNPVHGVEDGWPPVEASLRQFQ